ncbi:MAG: nuclear transport factor 2 family protein [Candidatus Binatia bacterium]
MPQRLLDALAVRDVVQTYALGVDRRDLGLVARCFTPDCEYRGSLGHGTIATALASLRAALPRYERTMHFMGTQRVAVDGDGAHAETCCVAYHVRPDGRHFTVGVRYLDDLARTPDGWRIRRRVVQTDWTREDGPTSPT